MPRLLDSAENSALGAWLDDLLATRLSSIRIQTGYADRRSLNYLCSRLVASGVQLVRLVLGANQGSLTADAALAAIAVVSVGADRQSGLRIVSYANALFHPKTIHAKRLDGSSTAYIGSANFTDAGLSGRNVEVGLILDTACGDAEELLEGISLRTDSWFSVPSPPGTESIQRADDIPRLVEAGLLATDAALANPGTPSSMIRAASRDAAWIAQNPRSHRSDGQTDGVVNWWKKLSASDAQRPPRPETNPTGKLRLSKSGLDIDPKTFFRDVLFANMPWRVEQRNENIYECTTICFDVTILGRELGMIDLLVDHAPHRIADQDNIPTVLAWGALGVELRSHDCTGAFVVITRNAAGQFHLKIQPNTPAEHGG